MIDDKQVTMTMRWYTITMWHKAIYKPTTSYTWWYSYLKKQTFFSSFTRINILSFKVLQHMFHHLHTWFVSSMSSWTCLLSYQWPSSHGRVHGYWPLLHSLICVAWLSSTNHQMALCHMLIAYHKARNFWGYEISWISQKWHRFVISVEQNYVSWILPYVYQNVCSYIPVY